MPPLRRNENCNRSQRVMSAGRMQLSRPANVAIGLTSRNRYRAFWNQFAPAVTRNDTRSIAAHQRSRTGLAMPTSCLGRSPYWNWLSLRCRFPHHDCAETADPSQEPVHQTSACRQSWQELPRQCSVQELDRAPRCRPPPSRPARLRHCRGFLLPHRLTRRGGSLDAGLPSVFRYRPA